MSAIRPFVAGDIPQVARLHQKVWGGNADRSGAYSRYFTGVFLENPAGDGLLSSLVCEDNDRRIVGFLGIVPRHVAIDGRCYRAAVSSQFIVEPSSQAGLVVLRLARTFLEGPQDLSIADEANDASRRIWERLGGTTALLHSIYWTRPLRPVRLLLSCLHRRRPFAAAAGVGSPLAALADGLAARLPGSYFRQRQPSAWAADLTGKTAVASAAEFCDTSTLRVVHDERTFQWLLDRVARRSGGDRVLNVTVRNTSTSLGWYVCRLDRDGSADVAQLAATSSTVHEVLDHLFHQAWRNGAVAVTGRLDPRFIQALSDKYCLFHRRGPWVLIHARRPELLRAFESGHAWFSPLDGEWSLRFEPEDAAR